MNISEIKKAAEAKGLTTYDSTDRFGRPALGVNMGRHVIYWFREWTNEATAYCYQVHSMNTGFSKEGTRARYRAEDAIEKKLKIKLN